MLKLTPSHTVLNMIKVKTFWTGLDSNCTLTGWQTILCTGTLRRTLSGIPKQPVRHNKDSPLISGDERVM